MPDIRHSPEAPPPAHTPAAPVLGRFSFGGNIGFAVAPLMVAVVVSTGGLRFSPLLAVPAVVGSALRLPVLRALERTTASGPGAPDARGTDDVVSFVRLSLAVVCRSVALVGLSTFVSLYARQRTGGGTAAGTTALFVLYLGGAAGTVPGSRPASRWDRVTVVLMSYLITVGAVAGTVFAPGSAIHPFIALTPIGLYVPFSLQVTLAQDYLPSHVGTAGGITLGPTVSIGGLAGPRIGSVADATPLQTTLTPLIPMPALSWLLYRACPSRPHRSISAPRCRPTAAPASAGTVRRTA
ncbi:MFS transporter [Streptomyces atratus]|uniref:MFS transporter n=1 Tax=Streptomyces atratus TaxID=1893 RepID=UPI0037D9F5EE